MTNTFIKKYGKKFLKWCTRGKKGFNVAKEVFGFINNEYWKVIYNILKTQIHNQI